MSDRCKSCGDFGNGILCQDCRRVEEWKGAAWARGAQQTLQPLMDKLEAINIQLKPIQSPTAEDGLRIAEALRLARATYGTKVEQ